MRELCFAPLLVAPGAANAAHSQSCTVADPTGTPLAIRDAPRGSKTGSLANGV